MKKLKCKKGFTLMETLACVVTLILVMLICTTGMSMAAKSHTQSMFESNSQKLEYILSLAVGDILRYSGEVAGTETDDGKIEVETFSNRVYGVYQGELKVDGSGYVVLVKNKDPLKEAWVVSTMNYSDGMYVDDFTLLYDPVTKVYEGSYTIKSNLTSRERLVKFMYKSIIESF